jgi:hypothetical protein
MPASSAALVLTCFRVSPANDIPPVSARERRKDPSPGSTLLCAIGVIDGLEKGCSLGAKNFQENEKKACHALAPSARGELRATNALISSFKKNLKK